MTLPRVAWALTALMMTAWAPAVQADAIADAREALADTVSIGEVGVTLWPPRVDTYGQVWIPKGLYSEGKGWGLGFETVLPFTVPGEDSTRTSEIGLEIMGTTKGQWRVQLDSDLYWNHDRRYARFRLDYDDLAREFYGLGPATDKSAREFYRPGAIVAYIEAAWGVGGGALTIGPRLEVNRQHLTDAPAGGQLDTGAVPGAGDETNAGAGVVLTWDRRDDRYTPAAGSYIQVLAMRFDDALVGSHHFGLLSADARAYRRLAPRQVLAAQAFFYGVGGDVPFWRLASLGGRHHTRAYPRDRWLDNAMLASQLEWRWRFHDHVGVNVFGGGAVVGSRVRDMQWRYVRPTLGAGLRLYAERGPTAVPIRLDMAIGVGHWRASMGIGEAF
jgi:hypothetical protein